MKKNCSCIYCGRKFITEESLKYHMIKFGTHVQILSIIIQLTLIVICLDEVKKMSDDFQKHRDKRISEIRERMRNSRIKKKEKVIIFSQNTKKTNKNINQIKSN